MMGTVNRHLYQEVIATKYSTKQPGNAPNGSNIEKKILLISPFVPIILHDRCKINQPEHFLPQQSLRLSLTESVIREASR
jgi:hypothetical protein